MNIASLRADTPGCAETIHFNNAGASLMPRPVLEATMGHLELESRIGGYHAAERVQNELRDTYTAIAALVGARGAHEIALCDSATRAYDTVLAAFPFQPGDRIVMSRAEYGSNVLAAFQLRKRFGVDVVMVPDNAAGTIDLEALEREASRGAALISLTHIPTSNGLVNPAEKVGEIARAHRIPFLLDACQSTGQQSVDVQAIGCDFLAATGRKYLRGPRGTGFLYVAEQMFEKLDPLMPDVRSADWIADDHYALRKDATRFEMWEKSVACVLGLRAAVRYALSLGLPEIEARITQLAETLRAELRDIPGCTVLDRGERRSGIVTFVMQDAPPGEIKKHLREHNINTSQGNLGSARWDLVPQGLDGLVRASVHVFNTEDEIARVKEVLSGL